MTSVKSMAACLSTIWLYGLEPGPRAQVNGGCVTKLQGPSQTQLLAREYGEIHRAARTSGGCTVSVYLSGNVGLRASLLSD